MADDTRMGDESPPPRRGGRLFRDADDGHWYFMTREGRPMGPFETEEEGRQALQDFLDYVSLADLQQLADLSRVLTPDSEDPATPAGGAKPADAGGPAAGVPATAAEPTAAGGATGGSAGRAGHDDTGPGTERA